MRNQVKVTEDVSFFHEGLGALSGTVIRIFKNGKLAVKCYIPRLGKTKVFHVHESDATH